MQRGKLTLEQQIQLKIKLTTLMNQTVTELGADMKIPPMAGQLLMNGLSKITGEQAEAIARGVVSFGQRIEGLLDEL